MKNQKKAYLYAFMTILFWSTVASAFKISLRYLDYLQLLFWATLVSTLTLLTVIIFQNKLHLLKGYSRRDYLFSALLGFLNPFLYYVVLLKAYSLLPAQEAAPLNYIWPIMLVLLSIILLKQKITATSFIAIFISFVGVVIIGTRGALTSLTFHNPLGVSLAMGSSIIWALFWIYNMKDTRDEVAKLFLNFLFGFLFIVITVLCTSKPVLPPLKGFLGASYIGLFEMGITFVLWLMALQHSETTAKAGNLVFISPFLSLIFIAIIVGERIVPSTIIGLIFIVTGILIQQLCVRSPIKAEKSESI